MNPDSTCRAPVPPDCLMDKWRKDYVRLPYSQAAPAGDYYLYLVRRAAAWGADEQLRLCVEWLIDQGHSSLGHRMKNAMRPISRKDYIANMIDDIIPPADCDSEYCKLTVKFLREIREVLSEDSD